MDLCLLLPVEVLDPHRLAGAGDGAAGLGAALDIDGRELAALGPFACRQRA